jgi:hypothetical protein
VYAEYGLCLDCDYPLRGLATPRCPECGRAFDPNDSWTMNVGRPMRRALRWLLRPPGRWTVAAAIVAAAVVVSDGNPGPTKWNRTELGLVLWAVIGIAWAARSLLRQAVARVYRQRLRYDPAAARRKVVAQWLFVVSVLCVYSGLPSYVRFFVLRPGLERVARAQLTAPSGGPPVAPASWLGLSFRGGRMCPHAVWFDHGYRTIGYGPHRFGYSPQGPCRNNGKFVHLFGSWYVAFED